MRRKTVLVALLLAVVSLLVVFTIVVCGPDPFAAEHERFRKAIKIGMTEEAVRSAMGEPLRAYTRETAPASYFIEGYAHPKHEISHKVLIFTGTETIAYVYFNDSDIVEYVFLGGS